MSRLSQDNWHFNLNVISNCIFTHIVFLTWWLDLHLDIVIVANPLAVGMINMINITQSRVISENSRISCTKNCNTITVTVNVKGDTEQH